MAHTFSEVLGVNQKLNGNNAMKLYDEISDKVGSAVFLPRKLFDEFKKYSINKKICLGSVRSDDARTETIDEIINHWKKGIDIFGEKISQIAPDCGQRMLPRDVALPKLKNLVKAGEEIYGR